MADAKQYTVADFPTFNGVNWAEMVPSLYRSSFNGRDLTQDEINSWYDRLNSKDGQNLNQYQVEAELRRSPEYAVSVAASQPQQITDRRGELNSQPYIERLLGPAKSGGWQDEARAANFGINAMPGVFSDYANPDMATGQLGDPRSQGNLLINSLVGLIPQQVDPNIMGLIGGNQPAGKKGKEKGGNQKARHTPNPEGTTFFERVRGY